MKLLYACIIWLFTASLNITLHFRCVYGQTDLNTTSSNTTFNNFVECVWNNDKEQEHSKESIIFETQLKLLHRYFQHGGIIVTDNPTYEQQNISREFDVIYTSPHDPSEKNLRNIVISLKESRISSYVISCSVKCTMEILKYAAIMNVTSEDYVWILKNKEIELMSTDLPKNILLVELDDILWTSTKAAVNESRILRTCERIPTSTRIKTRYDSTWKLIALYKRTKKKLTYLPNSITYLQTFPLLDHDDHEKHNLKIVTINETPFTLVLPNSAELYDPVLKQCKTGRTCWQTIENNGKKVEQPFCCVGYCIDLLEKLEHDLNFESYLYLVEDSTYGQIKNGTWVGMVGDLVYDKADLILAPLTVNTKRAQYIDYSYPFMIGGLAIVTIIRETELPFFNIEAFKPLSLELWAVVIALTIFVSILLILMENRIYLSSPETPYEWNESITYMMGLLFQKDTGGKNPALLSSRLCVIPVATGVLVIMTTYTAVLTANSVMHERKLPITGFGDEKIKNPTHDFKFGTLADSVYTQMFAESTDPNWNRMSQFMKSYNFKSSTKAIQRLIDGELDAVINDYYVSLHYIVKDPQCRIQFAGDIIKDPGYGLGAKKGSALGQAVSRKVQTYKELGILLSIERTWIHSGCSRNDKETAVPMEIRYFGGLFTFLILSCVAVGIILVLEILVYKYMMQGK